MKQNFQSCTKTRLLKISYEHLTIVQKCWRFPINIYIILFLSWEFFRDPINFKMLIWIIWSEYLGKIKDKNSGTCYTVFLSFRLLYVVALQQLSQCIFCSHLQLSAVISFLFYTSSLFFTFLSSSDIYVPVLY